MQSVFAGWPFIVAMVTVTAAILLTGSVMDYRRRSVNAFLFVPIVIFGIFSNLLSSSPVLFIMLSILAFAMSYLDPRKPVYIMFSTLFFVAGLIMLLMRNAYGFEFLVISVVHAIGYRQSYFGIGDTKAMIAVIFSFTGINVRLMSGVISFHGLIANGMVILVDIVIASVIFLILDFFVLRHSGIGNGLRIYRLDFSQDLSEKLGKKYGLRTLGGKKYLVYKVPFLIPITMGFFMFVIFGAWFI